jgi:AcrR family transcriptional regulator
VTLTRDQIVTAAHARLREYGLSGLSMRRIAQDLGVAPGAIYYHVAGKQELLVALAGRILGDAEPICESDAAQAASDIRAALLKARDSAEIVSFAHAYQPGALAPLRELQAQIVAQLPAPEAEWAAQTLIQYVLGFVAEEQNRDELLRAGVVSDRPDPIGSSDAFRFGVAAILAGVKATTSRLDRVPER